MASFSYCVSRTFSEAMFWCTFDFVAFVIFKKYAFLYIFCKRTNILIYLLNIVTIQSSKITIHGQLFYKWLANGNFPWHKSIFYIMITVYTQFSGTYTFTETSLTSKFSTYANCWPEKNRLVSSAIHISGSPNIAKSLL